MASTEALMPLSTLHNHVGDPGGGQGGQAMMSSGSNSQNSQKSMNQNHQSSQYASTRGHHYSKPRRVVFYKNGDRYFHLL